MFVVGVDGCRGGWLAIKLSREGASEARVFPDMAALWSAHRLASLILVDIPLGLPDAANDRTCDKAARQVLGARQASVFPVPCRAAVYAPTYDAALKINEYKTGKRLFRAVWNLIPRMRQVDQILRSDSRARKVIREAHPEVLFWGLNQRRPMACYKKETTGQAERLKVLQGVFPQANSVFLDFKEAVPRGKVAPDDLLDALAAAVTALMGENNLKTLPPSPERDAYGLPMEMVYFVPGI
uniref:DUF429 domain-containing protein n=1 Tax=Desulfobacca acetoxidans TaxID=60893 RepID=A0A7C3Z0V3_9BACT